LSSYKTSQNHPSAQNISPHRGVPNKEPIQEKIYQKINTHFCLEMSKCIKIAKNVSKKLKILQITKNT
jgi:hypothetical protein